MEGGIVEGEIDALSTGRAVKSNLTTHCITVVQVTAVEL